MDRTFVWHSRAEHIPARWDLRLIGWALGDAAASATAPRLYDGRPDFRHGGWREFASPRTAVAVGVACAAERAAMLAHGFGEALPAEVAQTELAIRLARLADEAMALPRYRRAGPLTLDLLHRDARMQERWLALHPREFTLLWRIVEAAGARVSRETLLADVWRLKHLPETNSLAVHISRLRAKLAAVGAQELIETHPHGGYQLAGWPHTRKLDSGCASAQSRAAARQRESRNG